MKTKQNHIVYQFGIETYQLDDIHVLATTWGDMSPESIDEWLVARADLLEIAEEQGYMLMLQDASHPGVEFTSYTRQRISEASNSFTGNADVYIALLVPDKILFNFIAMFLRNNDSPKPNLHRRVFTQRDKAINWLQSQQ